MMNITTTISLIFGSTGFANFNTGFDLCDFIFVEGIDPTLLIRNKNITTVRPDFQEDVRIISPTDFSIRKTMDILSPRRKENTIRIPISQAPQIHGVLNACVPGKRFRNSLQIFQTLFTLSRRKKCSHARTSHSLL